MRSKKISAHALLTAALAVALVASWMRVPTGQAAPPWAANPAAAGQAGRYQLVPIPRELNPRIALIDTHTGHVWTADATGGGWDDRGTPPAKQKE